MLIYIGLVWSFGVWRMHNLHWPAKQIASFNRLTLNRVVTFLTISYAPVTEVVISMYRCRDISGVEYLREDTSKLCLYTHYALYRRLAGFWLAFYVVGVPCVFLGLLVYYNVPKVARELQNNHMLRDLWAHAYHTGVALPDVKVHTLTTENIADEHLRLLYRAVVLKEEVGEYQPHVKLGSSDAGSDSGSSGILSRWWCCCSPGAREPGREKQLQLVLRYSSLHLHHAHITWHEAERDPRMAGAKDAISLLYEEFYADKWYWLLVETIFKLIITGVLGLIAPGTQSQVAVGMVITFLMLLFYQHAMPYKEKVFRNVGYFAAIELFVFLVLAMMLAADVQITGSGPAADKAFYGVVAGVLTTSSFALPAVLVLHRVALGGLEEEEDEEEESDDEEEEHRDAPNTHVVHRNPVFSEDQAPMDYLVVT